MPETAVKNKITPLGDNVVIRRNEKEKVSDGGVLIPETANQVMPQLGVVQAVGRGARSSRGELMPIDVKVTDLVCFPRYGGQEIELNGETLLIIKASDILCVLE